MLPLQIPVGSGADQDAVSRSDGVPSPATTHEDRHGVSFDDLVREMIEADRAAVAREHNIGSKERR